jgi:hypothetical protein
MAGEGPRRVVKAKQDAAAEILRFAQDDKRGTKDADRVD